MARKDYYLFRIRIFSIVTEDDQDPELIEEEPDLSGINPLNSTTHTPPGEPPLFGFTDWKNYPYGED